MVEKGSLAPDFTLPTDDGTEVSLSSHVVTTGGPEAGTALGRMRAELRRHFDISHATIQMEHATRSQCEGACPAPLALPTR